MVYCCINHITVTVNAELVWNILMLLKDFHPKRCDDAVLHPPLLPLFDDYIDYNGLYGAFHKWGCPKMDGL